MALDWDIPWNKSTVSVIESERIFDVSHKFLSIEKQANGDN